MSNKNYNQRLIKRYCKGYFNEKELRCHCGHCGGHPHKFDKKFLKALTAYREAIAVPMTITNGLRCDYWNRKVGGIPQSKHKFGRAVDFIVTDNILKKHLIALVVIWCRKNPTGFSYTGEKGKIMEGVIHIDL